MSRALWLTSLLFIPACGGGFDEFFRLGLLTEIRGTVGANGGTLTSNDGTLTLKVPAGALFQDTEVNITEKPPDDLDPQIWGFNAGHAVMGRVFDITPPLRFNTPATLTLQKPDLSRISIEELIELDITSYYARTEDDRVVIPDQRVEWDNEEGFILHGMAGVFFDEVAVGALTEKDQPAAGDDNVTLGWKFEAPPSPEINVPSALRYSFEHGNAYDVPIAFELIELAGNPNVAWLSNVGDAVPTTRTEANGRTTHEGEIQFEATQVGETALTVGVGFVLALDPSGLLFLVDVDHSSIGEYRMEVTPATANVTVGNSLRIQTGVDVAGLAPAHFDLVNDPPVVGTHPMLYVSGPDVNGVKAFAIERDASGTIVATPQVQDIGILTAVDDDVVPVSAGDDADLTRALYVWNPVGFARSHWAGANWGGLAVSSGVRDLVSFGGTSRSTGVSLTAGIVVGFQQFDDAIDFFQTPIPSGALGGDVNFPNRTGDPVSAFVYSAAGGGVIVAMSGSPGQIWYHDRIDASAEGALIASGGNDQRRVRAKNGVAVVSNYGSNTLTILTWNGTSAPTPIGTHTFASNPLADPLEIDMAALDDGTTAVAVASDTTGHWWLGRLDASGAVVQAIQGTMPGLQGLADIVILPGNPMYLAVACKGQQDVVLIKTAFDAPVAAQVQ